MKARLEKEAAEPRDPMDEVVQYIVVRKDLNMSKGKMAAQVAHASIATVYPYLWDAEVKTWLDRAFTKIILEVKNLAALEKLERMCIERHMVFKTIVDNGRTEVEPNTPTCLGFKPYKKSQLGDFLKKYQLYKD